MSPFAITILGCNAALPTIERNSTAQVVNINSRHFLIDCGEGTQLQMRRFKVPFEKINNIFISHLHGDHYYGIMGLLQTFSLKGRKNPLNLYAPAGLNEIITFLLQYSQPLGFELNFIPLVFKEITTIYEDKNITIETIPLKHRVPVCGFLFKEKDKLRKIKKEAIHQYNIHVKYIADIKAGTDFITENGEKIDNSLITTDPTPKRSYAFCTDTILREQIIPQISNVDVLYHEATFKHDMLAHAKATFHTTSIQAATLALKAGVKKLILGHFSSRYRDSTELENEAKTIFENSFAAYDGMVIKI